MEHVAEQEVFKFRLFVAGDTPNSTVALGNLRTLCREQLADRCEIDVVDVFVHPERALAEGIFMTPTLVVLSPLPQRRIIGTLSNPEVLTQALGLRSEPA